MKITIVGKANGWEDAPHEGIVWGIHSHCLLRPFTMVWDMHQIDGEELVGREDQKAITVYVNENKVPYMTLKRHDNIPTSIAFPIDEMPLKYAESSIAYMIWYAYHVGADEIELFGVNMNAFDEYHQQLKSAEYWIGYVRGKGVKVTMNEPTAICKGQQGLYGYDYMNLSQPTGSIYKGKANTREDWEKIDRERQLV